MTSVSEEKNLRATDYKYPAPYDVRLSDRMKAMFERRRFPKEDFRHYQILWNGIYGWLIPSQARWLFEVAKETAQRGAIVEIGSAYGRSTVCLAWGARLAQNGKVFAVDPHSGGKGFREQLGADAEGYSSLEGFLANIRRFHLEPWVEPVTMGSEEAAKQWAGGPIRLLFIDGWHTYEAVSHDILGWRKYMVSGGTIALHDYQDDGVKRAIHDSMNRLGIAQTELQKLDHQLVYFRVP